MLEYVIPHVPSKYSCFLIYLCRGSRGRMVVEFTISYAISALTY